METNTRNLHIETDRNHSFAGFDPPTSSTTYTPNQFFDVVLPHASRGCLRAVAYLIRKTLGWSDEEGNPQNPEAMVSFREFIEEAGVSRGALRPALDEAIEKRYLDCLQLGMANRSGEQGYSSLFSLKWDPEERYITKPNEFSGFFAGNGNLTHIPNAFFDYVVPNEPLAVVQVVGVIIRHTIGFQSKFGFRRQQVAMSFSEIMRRTGIGSRSTVSKAIKEAIERNYICKVSEGSFGNDTAEAAVYGIRWSDQRSSPCRAVVEDAFEPNLENGSKSGPGEQFKKWTRKKGTIQKVDQKDGSKNGPENGSEIEPESVQKVDQEAFRNWTSIKTTDLNNTPKQQQSNVDESVTSVFHLLVEQGFDQDAARFLSREFPGDVIRRQVQWLPLRGPSRNPLGRLRNAIEKDLPLPSGVQTSEHFPAAKSFVAHFYAELAGNNGEPLAEPSIAEIELAAKLLAQMGNTRFGEDSGRSFARFVMQQQSASKMKGSISLSLAHRLYADHFFKNEEEKRKQHATRNLITVRSDHEKQFEDDYRAYAAQCAMRIITEAGLEEEFLEHAQAKVERRKQLSARAYELGIAAMASPQGQLPFRLDFIQSKRLQKVLEFWDWDAQMNPNRFGREADL